MTSKKKPIYMKEEECTAHFEPRIKNVEKNFPKRKIKTLEEEEDVLYEE